MPWAESASDWIDDRDAEASMLLVVESESGRPVGIVVLAEAPISTTEVDVRIGYLIAEGVWGQGMATELVLGLVAWARRQPGIRTVTGGVDPANRGSVRVLEKCGFDPIGPPNTGAQEYQLEIRSPSVESGQSADRRLDE